MIMDISTSPIVYFISAFLFVSSASYLIYKIRKENLQILYPISVYLGSMAFFFFLLGFYQIYQINNLISIASFSMMFGASYIARFPLKLINENKEKLIFTILLGISIIFTLYTYSQGSADLQLKVANFFAFLVAGLFTIGFVIYSGLKTKNKIVKIKSISAGASLGLCCVVAHGLAVFPLLPFLAMPFFGLSTLNAPVLFAMSAPIAFIFVLIIGRHLHRITYKEVKK